MPPDSVGLRPEGAVRSIARLLLADRLDELARTAQERLDRAEPAYAAMAETTPGQKLAGMRKTLELALTRLAGEPIPRALARVTEDVGRQRAEQGVPLTAVVHSFQFDLRVIWEAIIDVGRSKGLSDDPAFLDGLLLAWEAINSNNVEVVDAYRRREADLDSHRVEVRNRAFERLILEGDQDGASVAEASAVLGLPREGRFLVLVADGVPTQNLALARCTMALQRVSLLFHFGYLGDELLGIVNLARHSSDAVHEMLEPFGAWRSGTAEIDHLARAALGVRLARAVIRSNADVGLRRLQANWIGSVMGGNEELTGLMAREVLTPILRIRERESVLVTLESFLQSGSVADVAERSYRHRNTIRKRLQAVEAATGLDMSIPAHVTLITMAVEWLKSPSGREFSKSIPGA
ncbi:MAG: helix-turn-helix domain-containing protein [Mycobacterium sp.]